jgi:hypothetical protein
VEQTVNLIVDLGAGRLEKECLDMLGLLLKTIDEYGEITTREILLVLLLQAQVGKELPCPSLNFTNNHWLLLANVTECSPRLSELLLVELPNIYNEHQVYFVSTCHYLLRTVRTTALKDLLNCRNIKLKKGFIETLDILLQKIIKEDKSYYALWVL